MKKKQLPLLIFRQTDGNHLTLPVLCHILEISELGGLLDLQTADSLDDMLRRIPADGPCIIAYSFMTPHLPDVWEEIQIVRRTARKDLFLLAGGSHPTGDSEGTLSMGFDVVCAGEGERTLPQIVRDILDNSDAVRGAVYRTDKEADLDASFFRVRFDRLTPTEKRYLRAMAELGEGQHRSGDIAEALGKKVESVSPTRSSLIKKGMIFSPGHGENAFTVPLFGEFMTRVMPGTP